MRTKFLVVLMAAFVLAITGTAMAQDSPTADAYGGVLGNEVSNSDDGAGVDNTAPATQTVNSDELPFTGLEVGLVVLAGFGLVMLGVAMRRTTRRSEN
jgi:hypothetical protein